jgi:hypothetical protein
VFLIATTYSAGCSIINWSDPETRGEKLVKKITPISSARAQIIISLPRVVAFIIYIIYTRAGGVGAFCLDSLYGSRRRSLPGVLSHSIAFSAMLLSSSEPAAATEGTTRHRAGTKIPECSRQEFSLDQAGMRAHGTKSPRLYTES